MKEFFKSKNTWIAMAIGAVILFVILYATGKQTLISKPTTTPTSLPAADQPSI